MPRPIPGSPRWRSRPWRAPCALRSPSRRARRPESAPLRAAAADVDAAVVVGRLDMGLVRAGAARRPHPLPHLALGVAHAGAPYRDDRELLLLLAHMREKCLPDRVFHHACSIRGRAWLALAAISRSPVSRHIAPRPVEWSARGGACRAKAGLRPCTAPGNTTLCPFVGSRKAAEAL